MSLKSCLRLLLSKFVKKSETEFIGKQAAPSSSFVSLTVPSSADLSGYGSFIKTTAPFDGYATLYCTGYASNYTFGIQSERIESKLFSNGDSSFLYVPIRKGTSVDFYCRSAKDDPAILSKLHASFIKNLGSS